MSQVMKMFLAASAAYLGVGGFQLAMAQNQIANGRQDPPQIERGRYVVKIGGCNECHTAGYATAGGKIPESQWLTGGKLGFRGEWGTTYPTNLRLFINSLTQDQWVQVAKVVQTRPPMPWWILHDMNERDLKAMYAYVKWLGPPGETAPGYVPPETEPVGPVVQFPAPPMKQRSPLDSTAK